MKVGDYVRNQYGIAKVIDIENNYGIDTLVLDNNICFMVDYRTGEINKDIPFFNKLPLTENIDLNKVKTSPNIIDLIEVGDLVKIEYYSLRYEKRVERLFETTYKDKEYLNLGNSKCDFMLINKEFTKHDKELEPVIKSIVTKENFEQMEYKL